MACVVALYSCASFNLVTPLHPLGILAPAYLASTLSGYAGIKQALESEIFKERTAKYLAMCSLIGTSLGVITAPAYAWLFNPKAATYFDKALPFLVALFLRVLDSLIFFIPSTGVLEICFGGLDAMEGERTARKREQETAEKQLGNQAVEEAEEPFEVQSPNRAVAQGAELKNAPLHPEKTVGEKKVD